MTYDPDDIIIQNAIPGEVFNYDFGDKRYFQVVFSNENEIDIQTAARTMMRVIYFKKENRLEGFQIIKKNNNNEDRQRLDFYKFDIQQLKCFLELIISLDFNDIREREITLVNKASKVQDDLSIRELAQLLSANDAALLQELLNDGMITNQGFIHL